MGRRFEMRAGAIISAGCFVAALSGGARGEDRRLNNFVAKHALSPVAAAEDGPSRG